MRKILGPAFTGLKNEHLGNGWHPVNTWSDYGLVSSDEKALPPEKQTTIQLAPKADLSATVGACSCVPYKSNALHYPINLTTSIPSLRYYLARFLLVSSWLSVSLHTFELVLFRRYFQRPNRPFFYKLGVGALIFFDTVRTITTCFNLCIFTLRVKGDSEAVLASTSLIIFMTYCSAAVETNSIIVTAFLAILILARNHLCDMRCGGILIAIALGSSVWGLLATDVIPSQRNSLSRRFFLLSISAGVIVESNTLLMMMLLLKHSPAFSLFSTCQNPLPAGQYNYGRKHYVAEPPGQYASAVTGVLFDIVYGYDTESASHQSLRAATGDSAIEVKGGPDRDSSIKSPAREQRRARPI
ncbi:hypothetical protein B0H13DRAFT_2317452 [Mycena leptocephala]|nr:hypothetical protein B0H13DRAFT_2317452 [Mycena leptocephala]